MKGQPLKSTRQRFQSGSLRKVARKTGFVWEYRYRDNSQPGCPLRQCTLSTTLYPTESKALAALQPMLVKINGEESFVKKQQATFSTLIDLYIESERLHEVKATRPGDVSVADGLQYSTACSYLTSLNRYIKPRWGDTLVHELKPAAVDAWLKSLTKVRKPGQTGAPEPLSPKTRGNIKGMMYRLLEKAMFWELVPLARNPVGLVEIRGVSKRQKKPFILTIEQYHDVVSHLAEPYKLMVQVAMCLGLRASEVLALKWSDFDFAGLILTVVRKVVHGRVDKVKTDYSEDELPLDSAFAELLLDWQTRCPKSGGNWLFPNAETGQLYHASPIQQDYIRAAGRKAKLGKDIGWHSFRHAYRSFLDVDGTPVGVQQKLMRHADIATTMNHYGNAQMKSKREANTKVVQMVLPQAGDGLKEAS
jgi:integrase